jgi:3-phosphoshikimate 1-carboxyvinyltransferase
VLRALGIRVDEAPDGATIHGGRFSGGRIDSRGDHRIAMSFVVAGQLASAPVEILDCANVATSFPGFIDLATASGLGVSPG